MRIILTQKFLKKIKKKKVEREAWLSKSFKITSFQCAELSCERGFSGPKAAVKVLKSEILIYHPFF